VTKSFVSYSQIGQDKFVFEQLKPGDNPPGTFLDIGCSTPAVVNNTFALEKLGWKGVLVDLAEDMVELCQKERTNPVFHGDATKIDWASLCDQHGLGRAIDYLSLDIDDNAGEESKALIVLRNLVAAGFSFRVITCEHDFYRIGDIARKPIREFLLKNSYRLVAADAGPCGVPSPGSEQEDWWVRP